MFTQKVADKQQMDVDDEDVSRLPQTVQARLVSETGEEAGPPIDLPAGVTVAQLGLICNALLQNVSFIRRRLNFLQKNINIPRKNTNPPLHRPTRRHSSSLLAKPRSN